MWCEEEKILLVFSIGVLLGITLYRLMIGWCKALKEYREE